MGTPSLSQMLCPKTLRYEWREGGEKVSTKMGDGDVRAERAMGQGKKEPPTLWADGLRWRGLYAALMY
jgi:hypothetical protein